MNVIVANKNEGLLNSLDIDIIKKIQGEFTAEELAQSFTNFYYSRMILDITALKDNQNIENIQKLSISLDVNKIILLLNDAMMSDNIYLSKLISLGIYNFANNKESIMYLLNHPNTYKDVAHIHQLGTQASQSEQHKGLFAKSTSPAPQQINQIPKNSKIIGFKNATLNAGSTTLVYMLKKYLSAKDYVVALEVNKNDFGFLNEKDMYSVNQQNIIPALNKFESASVILVDLNNSNGEFCSDIVYLIEPSIIKLNKMMYMNKDIFEKIYGKKIILNKSLLSQKDVSDFEFESHTKITYNMPPVNDRADNSEYISELIEKLEI